MDDTLTIDIESTNEANSGIDSLISKLEALKVRVNENLKAIGKLNGALIRLGANSKNVNVGNIKTPNVSNPANPTTPAPTQPTSNAPTQATSVWEKLKNAIAGTGAEANKAGRPIDNLGKKGEEAGKKTQDGAKKGASALSRLGGVANFVFGNIKKINSLAEKGLGKTLTLPFTSFFRTLPQGKKSLTDVGNAVETLAKKLRMTTLALLGARGAFTAIRKAVNAYMQYDTALAQTLQSNWAILGSLIAPVIERLIALFSKLVAYIATFIKMLTGVDLVARANAKALKSQASGASGASKAVKNLSDELGNLQKFDDLNVVDFPKDTGGGAGAGGGGAGAGLPKLAIDDIDMKPLERFLDFIKRNDWYGLGMEIARAFNDGLRLIDFDWLEQKARQWGKNMGDLFNGLTDGTDWTLVGEKIAGGLNTAMGFVNTFFDTYNFDHLGEGLARGINGIVDTVHWEDIGTFLTNKFNALVDLLYSLVTNIDFVELGKGLGSGFESAILSVDWGKPFAIVGNTIAGLADSISGFLNKVDWKKVATDFGTKFANGLKEGAKAIQNIDWESLGSDLITAIEDFITNIDWGSVVEALVTTLGTIRGAVWSFMIGAIETLVSDVVNAIKDYFGKFIDKAGFENAGMNIIAGIFEGIINAIKNIGQWIYDHIFKPFIDGFKKAFKIASPSKVMEEQGNFIVDGFFEGVKDIWEKVKGIFIGLRDNIKNVFTGIKDFIKEKVSDAVTWVKDKFSWSNIKNTFETIKTNIGSKFSDIKSTISDKATSASNTLKNAFKWDNIKSTFTNLVSKIKTKFGEIGTTVGTVLSSKFNEIVSKIINKAVDVINGFIRAINKAIEAINKIPKVNLKKLDTIDYPKLATGTNKIEVEGLYHLHQGEAVVPKKYNPAINNKMYSENNTQMLSRMDTLIDLLNNMETTNVVNVGNEEVYKETKRYINRQSNIYGTSNW